jgi:hypothetical protein
MCGGKNTSTTQTTAPNPAAGAAYSNILNQAGNVAATPYQPYGSELVAPINQQQNTGISNINTNAGYAQPFIGAAANYAEAAAQPITQNQIQYYQSPYTQDVINATMAQFGNQNIQQAQGVNANAVAQGAYGGNRVGVAQAELANQQQLAQAPVIAGLENQGYTQGLNTALTEQANLGSAAYSMGNLGVAGQNAALTGANAQIGAGTLQQQTQQAQDAALYQQYLNQFAYPFQTTQWLAGIDTGVGSQLGGTSTTTAPPPNPWNSVLGLGEAGIGAAGSYLGSSNIASAISALGPLAVAARFGGRIPQRHDGGVANFDIGGGTSYQTFGGGYGMPTMPYMGGRGFVPTMGITHGHGAPPPPNPPGQQGQSGNMGGMGGGGNSQANQIGNIAKILGSRNQTQPVPSSDPNQTLSFSPTISPIDTGGSDNMIYKRGGAVGVATFADGGGPDFDQRFSDVNQGDDQSWLNTVVRPGTLVDPQYTPPGGSWDERPPSHLPVRSPSIGIDPGQPMTLTPDSAVASSDVGYRGVVPDDDRLPALSTPTQQTGVVLPSNTGVAPPQNFFASNHNIWPALMAAGFRTMASRSPYLGVAVGEGGSEGMQAYSQEVQQERAATMKQSELNLEAQKLAAEVDHQRKALDQTTKYQGAEIGLRSQAEARERAVPHVMRYETIMDPNSGMPKNVAIYGTMGSDGQYHEIPAPASTATPPRPPIYAPTVPGAPTSSAAPPQTTASEWPSRASGGRVRGYDAGGTPTGDDAPDPDAAAWQAAMGPNRVPRISIGSGPTAPDQVPLPVMPDGAPPSDDPVLPTKVAQDAPTDMPPTTLTPQVPGARLFGIPGENAELTGEDYLNQFSPSFRAAVKDYVAGRSAPVANPRAPAVAWVKRAAQKYGQDIGEPVDDTTFAARRTYRTQMASAQPGAVGGQRNLLTTSLGHLADVAERAEALNNYNGPNVPGGVWVGQALNAMRSTSPDQHGLINALDDAVQRYSGEAEKLYSGNRGAESAREDTQARYGKISTPKDFAGALGSDMDLIHSKLSALEAQRDQVMGKVGGGDIRFLAPTDYENISRIQGVINRLRGVDVEARYKQLKGTMPEDAIRSRLHAEGYSLPNMPAPQMTFNNGMRSEAYAAIRSGAPREAVLDRLRKSGVDTTGL